MNDDKEIKVKSEFSWVVVWLMGYLFTVGYVGTEALITESSAWWYRALEMIMVYLVWPMILGDAIR